MLIDEIVKFCNSEYRSADTTHVCRDCNHPSECSGYCKKCLEQIHYPSKYPQGKKDYDCKNLLYFYVCDYTNKYASEMLYLIRKSEKLKEIDEYNILSIGCGAAPDLMAFEQYVRETDSSKRISYTGFDINELWKPIHDKIKDYHCSEIIQTIFKYEDVIEFFDSGIVSKVNIIVLQYVISHFYNTGQITQILGFFNNLVKNVVKNRSDDEPCVILINDVNSCNRGRDFFKQLVTSLQNQEFHGTGHCYYFEYRIQNEYQRYGEMHTNNSVLFDLDNIDLSIYEPWKECSSAQMLIEIN